MVRRRRGRAERRDVWLIAFLRVLILAVAVPGVLMCADRVEAQAEAVKVYRGASLCPDGTRWETAGDCVATTTGEILGKAQTESCTTDSNGLSSCSTSYSVEVRFGERTQSLTVDRKTYRAVNRGDEARLRLWHGEVVRLMARGRTEGYLTSDEWASAGWLFLGWLLLAGAWLAVFGLWLFPLVGGWLVLAVPYLMVAYNMLGLNPMGVLGWSIVAVLTVVGVWLMRRAFSEAVVWP
ncbi:hypothetical protein [Streptomyces sp. NPDC053431]|uniref:hypothetical protein n=1 Tax=Streptomyces sp. NPDC053431 TaxID=3365703 RepID=UPI0037D4DC01